MHHVELLLDEVADAAVRDQWQRLADAGLPSQAHHRGESNAPHVTLSMVRAWPSGLTDRLAPLERLPVSTELGGLTVFGTGPHVVVRPLVVTAALLDLHHDVARCLGEAASAFVAPGRWVPHVTLARRMSAEQVAGALAVVASDPALPVLLDRARHWDSELKVQRPLHPARAAG